VSTQLPNILAWQLPATQVCASRSHCHHVAQADFHILAGSFLARAPSARHNQPARQTTSQTTSQINVVLSSDNRHSFQSIYTIINISMQDATNLSIDLQSVNPRKHATERRRACQGQLSHLAVGATRDRLVRVSVCHTCIAVACGTRWPARLSVNPHAFLRAHVHCKHREAATHSASSSADMSVRLPRCPCSTGMSLYPYMASCPAGCTKPRCVSIPKPSK
jgi:hypothetical protein